MTLQASGPISLADIAGEFGGSTPHSLNEYYKGGGLVNALATDPNGIPTSGLIDLQDFYGSAQYVAPSTRYISGTGGGNTPQSFFGSNYAYGCSVTDPGIYPMTEQTSFFAVYNFTGGPQTVVQIALGGGLTTGEIDTLVAALNGDSFVGCQIGTSVNIGSATPGTLRGGWFRLDGTFTGSVAAYNISITGPNATFLEGMDFLLSFTP